MAWNLKFWNNKTEKREVVYENPYGFGLGFSNFQGLETMPAISLSAVFSAIELIANSVAELPIDVKTRQANKTTVIPNHPVYHVFENCL